MLFKVAYFNTGTCHVDSTEVVASHFQDILNSSDSSNIWVIIRVFTELQSSNRLSNKKLFLFWG